MAKAKRAHNVETPKQPSLRLRLRASYFYPDHAMPDHINMCLSIPPKFSVARTIGFLKGKSAVRIQRQLLHERRMTGLSFWATGYCVSTVGLDEETIRRYIQEQERLESGQGELDLK
jgi:putative transposase